MTIQEIEQKLNECQKALAELKESKKEGKWKPKHNEEYWYRDSTGTICHTFYIAHNIDEWRIDNIPIFKTREECERYWQFMDTVKEKSYEFSREEIANDNIRKFSICYIPSRNSFVVTHNIDCEYLGTVYFKAEEEAQYIIDNFKDELMEYFV